MNAFPLASASQLAPIGFAVILAACSVRKGDTAMSSQTYYLANADAQAGTFVRTPRGTPVSKPASESPPSPAPQPVGGKTVSDETSPETGSESPPALSANWIRIQNLPDAEQVSILQTLLLKHVNTLSNEQADSACLILQIIPREGVFDRSIKPRQKLLDYVRQINTVNDLLDVEKALNNPSG